MWEGVLKCLLQFLLQSKVTKGWNFFWTIMTSVMVPGRFQGAQAPCHSSRLQKQFPCTITKVGHNFQDLSL